MKRNAAIELYRCLLMFGICLCHSIGAGGYSFAPLRNVCMMCTVGFVFITGWFGTRLSVMRIVKLLGIAFFAWLVVAGEELLLFGVVKNGPVSRMMEWWFLRSYLIMMVLSPILNSIVVCTLSSDSTVRRDSFIAVVLVAFAIYGLAWPMVCGWLPQIRVFMTIGCPCQPGTMCAIYILARVIKVTGVFDRFGWKFPLFGIIVSSALAICSSLFSYYDSPAAFVFAACSFYFFYRLKMPGAILSKLSLFAAPSMFFIYLYHSHEYPGFVLLKKFQFWLVDGGMWIPLAWLITAIMIFAIGLMLDLFRRLFLARAVKIVSLKLRIR